MLTEIISTSKCANLTLVHHTHPHILIETVLLSFILLYILILNITVIVVTIGSAELRGCLFSMQLAGAYLGNILGGVSLVGNDLYSTTQGVLPICQKGLDYYTCLYFGLAISMMALVLNSRFRYRDISKMRQRKDIGQVSTRHVVIKGWTPIILISVCICFAAITLQWYIVDFQLLISMAICVPPLVFSIMCNVLLTKRLKHAKKNSRFIGRKQSVTTFVRATFIINATIVVHVAFILLSSVAIVITVFYYEEEVVVIVTSWLLRLLFFLLFTVEGHVYLAKVKPARYIAKRKILHCLGCAHQEY